MKSKYYFNTYTIRAGCCLALLMSILAGKLVGQGLVEMSPGITTEVTGSIQVETNGHFLNHGALLPGTSTLLLHGASMQQLRQNDGAFHHLNIDKSAGEVTIMSDINLNGGTLSVFQQDVLLNGYHIMLDPTAVLNEMPGQTVKGPLGFLSTTRMISAPAGENIAGMGLMLSNVGDFGSTEIRRGHAAQSVNSHEGILRYFDVFPGLNVATESSLQFMYDESELNGNTENQLKLFHSPDGGTNWIEVGGNLNEAENRFEAAGIHVSSRYTLSSFCLETCMATTAVTKPAIVYLNAAGLGFIQPADVDNGSTGACGIDSLTVIPEAFTCADLGTSEVVLIVTDNNGCTKTSSASIEVIDEIAPSVVCKNITVFVGESCNVSISPNDLDDGSYDACGVELSINVASFDCSDVGPNLVTLTATDPSGNVSLCEAIVTVEMEINVECQDAMLSLDQAAFVEIDPFDLITGDPGNYAGYTFIVQPEILYCNELGTHEVSLTSTDPLGNVTICEVTVTLNGPDADCDGVADQCDLCDGGNDMLDTDADNIPDCADWDGWANLIEEWQCANNKVFLCHDGNVICVNQNAVQAHLDHGDFMGSCSAVFCDDPPALQTGEEVMASTFEGISNLEVKDKVKANLEVNGMVLTENRPNPFFPETTIRFYLPMENRVSLIVFDMIGAPVKVLAEGIFEPGWHEVIFDGTAHADGMYFYVLKTSSQCNTRSMILAR